MRKSFCPLVGFLVALSSWNAAAQQNVLLNFRTGTTSTAQVSSSNPLPITGTITSSGSVTGTGTAGTAAAGVLTVQGIASMTPVQVSQATASNLNATIIGAGAAGTANAGVVTVQGIAAMTPLLATLSGTNNIATVTTLTGITNTVTTQELGASFVNITTNTDTNVKGSAGTFVGITVNTAGTTSTAKIYNDGDGTCNSGLIATVNTAVLGTDLLFNAAAGTGVCVTTAGAAAADITVLYR